MNRAEQRVPSRDVMRIVAIGAGTYGRAGALIDDSIGGASLGSSAGFIMDRPEHH